MKKTYIIPSMTVVRLAMSQPLAGSLNVDGNSGSATFHNTGATGAGMTREQQHGVGSGLWSDMQ